MPIKLELPEEVFLASEPESERAALEAVLLLLISEDRMSLAPAGEILGLDRTAAIR